MPPEAAAPPGTPGVVRKLIESRPWLFEDEFYHIDVSHLSSVVQMSIHLGPGKDLDMVRELPPMAGGCPAVSKTRAIRRSRISTWPTTNTWASSAGQKWRKG